MMRRRRITRVCVFSGPFLFAAGSLVAAVAGAQELAVASGTASNERQPVLGGPAATQAAAPAAEPPRPLPTAQSRPVRFSISGGLALRSGEVDFSDNWSGGETKTLGSTYYSYKYVWKASWNHPYRSSSSPLGPHVSADVWLSNRLALGVGWEHFTQELSSEPALKFDITQTYDYRYSSGSTYSQTSQDAYSASATADDLTQRQRMVHVTLTWRQPVADRTYAEISAGPTFIGVEQQVMRKAFGFYDCDEGNSYSDNVTGCRLADSRVTERGSIVGFNVGAALAFDIQPKLTLLLQARYVAGGRIELSGMDTEWLLEAVDDLLPYSYPHTGSRTTLRVKTSHFMPRIALRYRF